MNTKNTQLVARAAQDCNSFEHLVGGGGGSRAILAISGMMYAMDLGGIDLDKLESIGGISGGAMPTLMLAQGMKPAQIVCTAVDVDFADNLVKHGNTFQLFYALLMKERYERTKPIPAIFSTEKVAEYFDSRVPTWPEKFWCMAVHKENQILFTARGVFQCSYDGTVTMISNKPALVSDAIRGSMAVPGIIRPRYWKGRFLFDGVLSWDGLCPVGVVLRNFGADPHKVIACDVRDQNKGKVWAFLKKTWERLLVGLPWSEEERSPRRFVADGITLVEPELNKFGSLKFKLTEEEKWEAVISSFCGTLKMLHKQGKVSDAKLAELEALAADSARFIDSCREAD